MVQAIGDGESRVDAESTNSQIHAGSIDGSALDVIRGFRSFLKWLDLDTQSEALQDTPLRAFKALQQMTTWQNRDVRETLATTFASDCSEMVVVSDVDFVSVCEHHLMPFVGTVTLGYLPNGRVVGLSKIPRLIRACAEQLQIQERMTSMIAEAFNDALSPLGVGVVVRASHSCMACRGVRSRGVMTTSHLIGKFRDDVVRSEFLMLAHR